MALYPAGFIPSLHRQQHHEWAGIIDEVAHLSLADSRVMAFSFTVRVLRQQFGLDNDCFDPRCAKCAHEVLTRFEGTETELVELFRHNLLRIQQRVENRARTDHARIKRAKVVSIA